jgi:hypothetical protein
VKIRSLTAAVLVLAAACATGGRPRNPVDDRPSIVGNYLLTRIDNRSLPTYSPTEPNVTLFSGSLVLGNAGAFGLTLLARNSPQMPPAERSLRGSYEATGDSLISVTPSDRPEGAPPLVYRVRRAGVQLTLRDEQGHRYEFVIR